MDNDVNFLLKGLNISQLGYVYRDIRKQASIMEKFFGVPKFNILGPLVMEIFLRGKQTKWTALGGYSRLFEGVEIEILQPEGGESIHKEFLEQGREGLHHIRYDVDNFEIIIDQFKKESIEVLQSGKIIGLKYAYMDTESLLGIIIEFSAVKKGRKRR